MLEKRERESVKETHSRKIKFGRERDMETGFEERTCNRNEENEEELIEM